MNDVRLYGRIANDLPNVEELSNKPLLLILAVDKFVAGEKDADFIPIKVWGKHAKNLCEYKTKGDELIVYACLRTGMYEKDGIKLYPLECSATHIQFVGSRRKGVSQNDIDNANEELSDLENEDKDSNLDSVDTSKKNLDNNSSEFKDENIKDKDKSSNFGFDSPEDEAFFESLMGNTENPFK